MKWKLKEQNIEIEGKSFVRYYVVDENNKVICSMDADNGENYGEIIAKSNELYNAVKESIEASNSNNRFNKGTLEKLKSIIDKIESN